MKLLQQIINELVDNENQISSSLLMTKVLANRLNNEELIKWVSNELKGYDGEDNLPSYRKFEGKISGTFILGNMQYKNQPIPLNNIGGENARELREMNLYKGISELEKLRKENDSGSFEYSFPPEVTYLIEASLRELGNPDLQLMECKRSLDISSVDKVLSNVRNSLLDFVLKIDSEFGDLTELAQLKEKKGEINEMFSRIIINTYGDGNVVTAGNDNNVYSEITIEKGNKEDLKKYLKASGLMEDDISELTSVIDSEKPDRVNGTFGNKVKGWISKMLSKALDGAWEIGVGAAGNLLTEAIKMYYGL